MVDTNPQFSGRIVAGRYRLGPKLGGGQEAAAFDAFDEQLQRMVVLKVVHPDLGDAPQVRRQFRSTMAVAAGIDHPNVAPVLDFGTDQWGQREVLYVVTERFGGGSLRDLLDRGRLLTPSQALTVGLDACKALDAVHRAGLVHGDVRPATLVFGDDRRVRLLDVGLAEALQGGLGELPTRGIDRVRYCSPEQAQGAGSDQKGDVYSLCLTLIEALSGAVPFEGDSAVSTMTGRIDRLMPVSADLGALAAVLERAGRPHAEDRYTAAEFGRALVRAAEKLPRPTPIPVLSASPFSTDATPSPGARVPGDGVRRDAGAAPAPSSTRFAIDTSNPVPAPSHPRPGQSVGPPDRGAAVRAARTGDMRVVDEGPSEEAGSKKWLIALLVLVALLGGALAWYVTRPNMVEVPRVIGLEEAEARNQVSDFEVVVVDEPNEDVEAGLVVGVEPEEGSSLEKGQQLTLIVSSGPAPRVLPDLAGMTMEAATAELEGAGLVIQVGDPAPDETVAKGSVLSWEVVDAPTLKAGDTVTKGTTVKVVPSSGPALRTIPDLTGKSLEEATTTLEEMGLVVVKGDDVFHPTAPVGTVAVAAPAFGTQVERDSSVTLQLSKGPELVALPPFQGLSHDAIVNGLKALGFAIGKDVGNPAKACLGYNVNGALALPGMQFPKGTVVDVFFKS